MSIRLAGIASESIVDGPGIRFVIFTQGCPHRCLGCHNPETHNFEDGYLETIDNLVNKFKSYPYMSGLTISGGEPFVQPLEILLIINEYKKIYPQKNIMIFTGYKIEELFNKNDPIINEIIDKIDYLVDGKFVLNLRDISLHFRGSSNQRIIDIKKSKESGSIIIKDF